jgi:enamine deaminase RidA (YjgF/YER057c/UK114 family)
MLPRRRYQPDGHWWVGLDVNSSQGLGCGPMIFIAGQVDLDAKAVQQNPGDLVAQTRRSMAYVGAVLAEAGAVYGDLVKLTVFYVNDGTVDEQNLLGELAAGLGSMSSPGPAITLVPVVALAFPGMEIEIEAIAMRGQNGEVLPRTAAWASDCPAFLHPFSQALRCGEMLFTSGISAEDISGNLTGAGSLVDQSEVVLPKIDRLLRQLGADLNDAVKTNVFNVEPGKLEQWGDPALVRAAFYDEPGPAATGISLPSLVPNGVMLRNDVIAMRGLDGARLPRQAVWPDDHWDWPVHLPYRHGLACGDLVFLGGQVALTPEAGLLHPGDMTRQTEIVMQNIGKVLAELGLGFEHVVKVNSFYCGGAGTDTLRSNAEVRFSHFESGPGPTSTGVPVPYLAYEDMVTEIDIIAMR